MKRTRELTLLALLAALAMVLSYLESLLPSVGIPGVKLGLANVAVICALYRLGFGRAVAVSLVRVATVSLLFASFPALAYSAAGAVVSLAVMALIKRGGSFSRLGVSVAGGVSHNLGQVAMAVVLLGTRRVLWLLPVLLLSGTLTGAAIGLASGALLDRWEDVDPSTRPPR